LAEGRFAVPGRDHDRHLGARRGASVPCYHRRVLASPHAGLVPCASCSPCTPTLPAP
jgi:hypothetical protein